MKSGKLLEEIKNNIKDYDIEYLEKKTEDERYPDNIYKHLAQYNSKTYNEIFNKDIEDFEINDIVLKNLKEDLEYFFKINDIEESEKTFIKAISLYLALISKKPLHPVGDLKTHDVYKIDNTYYCKGRIKYIKDKNSLCKYCICKKAGYYPI